MTSKSKMIARKKAKKEFADGFPGTIDDGIMTILGTGFNMGWDARGKHDAEDVNNEG